MYHFLSISKGPCTIAKRVKQIDEVRELLHVSNIVLWNLGKKLVQTTEDLAADFTGSDQESNKDVPEGSEDGPLVSTRPNDLEIPVVITGPTGICLYIYKYIYISTQIHLYLYK